MAAGVGLAAGGRGLVWAAVAILTRKAVLASIEMVAAIVLGEAIAGHRGWEVVALAGSRCSSPFATVATWRGSAEARNLP